MNESFQRLMSEATRLTQQGDLQAATAAIQAALAGAAAQASDASPNHRSNDAPGNDTMTIDVEAREIRSEVPTFRFPERQFLTGNHTDSSGTRSYKLYVPPSWEGRSLPLVVMLHGCTQNPDDFAAGTRMNEAAREQGFFVLYPAQAQKANASRCWNWFKHTHQRRGRGEPALLAGMTREVIARYDIDPNRVYVAGLSAGGAMATILGDAYPDVFAAVGVHSGLPAGSATDVTSALAAMKSGAGGAPSTRTAPRPSTPSGAALPIIVFHGDQDTTVHPMNGAKVVAATGVDAADSQVERTRSDNGRDYTRHVYRDQSGRVMAEHWVVHGAGHAWSGGHADGSYTDAQGPDATAAMLEFFFAHPRVANANSVHPG